MLRRQTARKTQMSVQRVQQSPEPPKQKFNVPQKTLQGKQLGLGQVIHNSVIRRHHIVTRNSVDPTDKSLLFKYSIPAPLGITYRKKHIVFKNTQYIISNWSGDQFPSVIYVNGDGFFGFIKNDLTESTRIAALQLDKAQAVIDQSGVRTYELIYNLRDPLNWELPPTMTDIKLRLSLDDDSDFVELPLPNPITLNFQLRLQMM